MKPEEMSREELIAEIHNLRLKQSKQNESLTFRDGLREGAEERDRLQAELDALRELEADNARLRKQDKGSTHHADCYRQHGHHECAMRVIDQLRADNAKLREYAQQPFIED